MDTALATVVSPVGDTGRHSAGYDLPVAQSCLVPAAFHPPPAAIHPVPKLPTVLHPVQKTLAVFHPVPNPLASFASSTWHKAGHVRCQLAPTEGQYRHPDRRGTTPPPGTEPLLGSTAPPSRLTGVQHPGGKAPITETDGQHCSSADSFGGTQSTSKQLDGTQLATKHDLTPPHGEEGERTVPSGHVLPKKMRQTPPSSPHSSCLLIPIDSRLESPAHPLGEQGIS